MALIVDTGAVELLRRGDRRAEGLILRHYPPVLCAHVVGEFLFGQSNGNVSTEDYEHAQNYLNSFEFIQPGFATAEIYADIRAKLGARGFKMSDPDYWIAAHAVERNEPVLSTDRGFCRIEGLWVHLLDPTRAQE